MRHGADIAVTTFIYVAAEVCLTVNLVKTRMMATALSLLESDGPLSIGASVIESVPGFCYLGSLMDSSGHCSAMSNPIWPHCDTTRPTAVDRSAFLRQCGWGFKFC